MVAAKHVRVLEACERESGDEQLVQPLSWLEPRNVGLGEMLDQGPSTLMDRLHSSLHATSTCRHATSLVQWSKRNGTTEFLTLQHTWAGFTGRFCKGKRGISDANATPTNSRGRWWGSWGFLNGRAPLTSVRA